MVDIGGRNQEPWPGAYEEFDAEYFSDPEPRDPFFHELRDRLRRGGWHRIGQTEYLLRIDGLDQQEVAAFTRGGHAIPGGYIQHTLHPLNKPSIYNNYNNSGHYWVHSVTAEEVTGDRDHYYQTLGAALDRIDSGDFGDYLGGPSATSNIPPNYTRAVGFDGPGSQRLIPDE